MEELLEKDIELITKQRKNSKNHTVLKLCDRLLLRKRAIIESVNDFLKNICQIEHSRHRSDCNFITNLVSELVTYSFLPKKPSIHFHCQDFLCSHNRGPMPQPQLSSSQVLFAYDFCLHKQN